MRALLRVAAGKNILKLTCERQHNVVSSYVGKHFLCFGIKCSFIQVDGCTFYSLCLQIHPKFSFLRLKPQRFCSLDFEVLNFNGLSNGKTQKCILSGKRPHQSDVLSFNFIRAFLAELI